MTRAGQMSLGVLAFGAWAGGATADISDCTAITNLPVTITAPGVYCLRQNLQTPFSAQAAIEILADDVTLDLNGYSVEQAENAFAFQDGIEVRASRHVTVRNGVVRGFSRGVFVTDWTGALDRNVGTIVEGLTLLENGIHGISISGTACTVRDNIIVDTGGPDLYPGTAGTGIDARCLGGAIFRNDIAAVRSSVGLGGISLGISLWGSQGVVVEGNRISHVDIGVLVPASASDIVAAGNRLSSMAAGLVFAGTGSYRDTFSLFVQVVAAGGTDAGHNQ